MQPRESIRQSSPGSSVNGGFTLIEVLMVMAVFSVILLLVTESYTRTFALFRRAGEDLARTRAVLDLTDDLTADLASAWGAPVEEEEGSVMKLRTASAGRQTGVGDGNAVFEIRYRTIPSGPKAQDRVRLVREVRREGRPEVLDRRDYKLELAGLDLQEYGQASARQATAVRIEYFLGSRLQGTDSTNFLVEMPLLAGGVR